MRQQPTHFHASRFRCEEERWQAVIDRDAAADGLFWYGVVTTGIYCRPQCPSRAPKRVNVRFFGSPEEARAAGFRACRRCRPDAAAGTAGARHPA